MRFLLILSLLIVGCGSASKGKEENPAVNVTVQTPPQTVQPGQMDFYDWLDAVGLSFTLKRSQIGYTAWIEDSQIHAVGGSAAAVTVTGTGSTPTDAAKNYCLQIRGRVIVTSLSDASKRREYFVPSNLAVAP